EAIDQPWKRRFEGTVGGYWGLIAADGKTVKFAWGEPVSNHPAWRLQAAGGVAFAAAIFALALLPGGGGRALRGLAPIWRAWRGGDRLERREGADRKPRPDRLGDVARDGGACASLPARRRGGGRARQRRAGLRGGAQWRAASGGPAGDAARGARARSVRD